jgi:hypothetical protein
MQRGTLSYPFATISGGRQEIDVRWLCERCRSSGVRRRLAA